MSVEFFQIDDRFRSIEFVVSGGRTTITAGFQYVDSVVSMSMRTVTDAERRMVGVVARGFFDTRQPVFQGSRMEGGFRAFRHPRNSGYPGSHVISEYGEVVAADEMERRVEAPGTVFPAARPPVPRARGFWQRFFGI